MSYSSMYNVDASRLYKILLDGEAIADGVRPHHVPSIIYDLELNDVNVVDEHWDEEKLEVHLLSTSLLDGEDHLYDEQ